MTTQRDDLAREIFIADNSNQPREQSIIDWEWFESTPRYAVRIERYKEMAAALIAIGWTKPSTNETFEWGIQYGDGDIDGGYLKKSDALTDIARLRDRDHPFYGPSKNEPMTLVKQRRFNHTTDWEPAP